MLDKAGIPHICWGSGSHKNCGVVLDLFEESRTRRKLESLTKIMEFHDVQKVGLFKGILEQKGIPCILQGYYHRSLLYLLRSLYRDFCSCTSRQE